MAFINDNKNFQSQLTFEVKIHRLPHVSFNIQRLELPGLELSPVAVPTTINRHFVHGDELQFQPLEIGFKVQEGMEDWYEIFQWMIGLSFPDTHQQFAEIRQGRLKKLDISKPQQAQETTNNPTVYTGNLYSDITAFVLTSKGNPYLEATFKNCWPSSLSNLPFNTTDNVVRHIEANVRFRYDTYNVKKI